MEVELRLKVKGVTIELTPEDARELVTNLAKLTGQKVDEKEYIPSGYWPWYWPAPYTYETTVSGGESNVGWTQVYSIGDTSVEMRAS